MRVVVSALMILVGSTAMADEIYYSGGAEASLEFAGPNTIKVTGLKEAPGTICQASERTDLAIMFKCGRATIPLYRTSETTLLFGSESFQLYRED